MKSCFWFFGDTDAITEHIKQRKYLVFRLLFVTSETPRRMCLYASEEKFGIVALIRCPSETIARLAFRFIDEQFEHYFEYYEEGFRDESTLVPPEVIFSLGEQELVYETVAELGLSATKVLVPADTRDNMLRELDSQTFPIEDFLSALAIEKFRREVWTERIAPLERASSFCFALESGADIKEAFDYEVNVSVLSSRSFNEIKNLLLALSEANMDFSFFFSPLLGKLSVDPVEYANGIGDCILYNIAYPERMGDLASFFAKAAMYFRRMAENVVAEISPADIVLPNTNFTTLN
jgi:hypothetical protein